MIKKVQGQLNIKLEGWSGINPISRKFTCQNLIKNNV